MFSNENKKTVVIISFILIIINIVLTFLIQENKYFHICYQILIIPVILLSIFFPIKDIIIIIMVVSGIVWVGFRGEMSYVNQLLIETIILIISTISLGCYEFLYKKEKEQLETVIHYKRKQIEEIKNTTDNLTKENNLLLEEIKEIKKRLTV